MNQTPQANRTHISIIGKRNSGKSSLINALTGQETALVSDTPGTTTDLVYKPMEIKGIGASVFMDTPGIDDVGELGKKRIDQTIKAIDKTDIALVLFDEEIEKLEDWIQQLTEKNIPFIPIINKIDLYKDQKEVEKLAAKIEKQYNKKPIWVSAKEKSGIDSIIEELVKSISEETKEITILGDRVSTGDLVLLVMPQDIQAPAGRLILPQVQTIRELLDRKCLIMSCTTDQLENTLQALAYPPKLIITDSQAFKIVNQLKPQASQLTSFSVLFAEYKGDIEYFKASVQAINHLKESSRVLIAEACAHAPQKEDIGRVKIPRLLRNKIGEGLTIDMVSGNDFPADLSSYDLIIHCGACMFNRKHVLTRIAAAKKQQIPMTNYGVAIAFLLGVDL